MLTKILLLLFTVFATTQAGNCLTPIQDAQIELAVSILHKAFVAAEASCEIAAALEKNSTVAHNLKLAAQALKVIDKEVVQNLTNIANETCGTCKELTQAIDDMVSVVEDTLRQLVPGWENNAIFNAIVKAIQAVFDIVKATCPSTTLQRYRDGCLDPQQQHQLEEAVKGISIALEIASTGCRIASLFEQDPTVKSQLEQASRALLTINTEIVQNLEQIANSACGTCSQITDAVNQIVQVLEKTIAEIFPEWKSNPIFQAVVMGIEAVIGIVKQICPEADSGTVMKVVRKF